MLVAGHHVVDVGRLVGEMVEPALVAANAEERVMVDVVVAAVEPVERADHVVRVAGIEFVRAAEAQHLAIPAERLLEILAHHHEMAEPLDVRRARIDPEQFALAPVFVVAGIDPRAMHRDRVEHLHAINHLNLIAVGVDEAHPLAAAGLVDVLDLGGAGSPRDPFEILHAAAWTAIPT